ncbi:hypothetical protein ARTHROSP310_33040 [Arthrobacter sp. AD-310]
MPRPLHALGDAKRWHAHLHGVARRPRGDFLKRVAHGGGEDVPGEGGVQRRRGGLAPGLQCRCAFLNIDPAACYGHINKIFPVDFLSSHARKGRVVVARKDG